MDGLFRSEAVHSAAHRLEGDVFIPASRSLWIATIVLVAFVLASMGFVLTAHVPRVQQVPGWLTTTEGLVEVDAFHPGVVDTVDVHDGQFVRKGDILATVRVEVLQTDIGGTPERALLSSMREQDGHLLDEINAVFEQTETDSQRLTLTIAALKEEAAAVDAQIAHQESIVGLSRNSEEVGEVLAKKNAYSRRQLWADQQDVAEKSESLGALHERRANLSDQLTTAEGNLARAPLDRDEKVAELQAERSALQQRLTETQGQRSYALTAPVDGRVTELVARPGYPADGKRPLLSIIPDHAKFAAELYVPSSAIAFVKTGQEVRLLYDAFPYELFGSQIGHIVNVASSALLPGDVQAPIELKEPVYLVTVKLDQSSIAGFGEHAPLQAGMTLQANVVLESRNVFQWLFEPLYAVRGRS